MILVDVAGDGNCMLHAISLAYLFQGMGSDDSVSSEKFRTLFGDDKIDQLVWVNEYIRIFENNFAPITTSYDWKELIHTFRTRIISFIREQRLNDPNNVYDQFFPVNDMTLQREQFEGAKTLDDYLQVISKKNVWLNEYGILAASHLLNCSITVNGRVYIENGNSQIDIHFSDLHYKFYINDNLFTTNIVKFTTSADNMDIEEKEITRADTKKSLITLNEPKINEPSRSKFPTSNRTSTATYAAHGLKTSLHGTFYQLQLLMLYAHRGLERFAQFDLATEMDQADKFDDIVFRYKNHPEEKWHWIFLQAKHKNQPERDKISIKSLLIDTEGPFSVKKYFLSFCKIKANPTFANSFLEDFVLCTNTNLDFEVKGSKRDSAGVSQKSNTNIDNVFVEQLKAFIVHDSLPVDSMLFCDSRKFQAICSSFSNKGYDDLSLLIKTYFLEVCQKSKIIEELNAISIFVLKMSIDNACKLVDGLQNIALINKKGPNKGKYQETVKCILKLEGKLPIKNAFKKLKDKFTEFDKPKSDWQSLADGLYNHILHIKPNLDDGLKKAKAKELAFRDKNSNQFKVLMSDFDKLHTMKKDMTTLGNSISKCEHIQALQHELKNTSNKKLKQITRGTNLDFKELKEQILEYVNNSISEIVIIEVTFDANNSLFDSYLKEFLSKFKLLTNYPNVEELNRIIKKEFRLKFSLLNADLLTNSFEREMTNWFMEYKHRRATFLSDDRGRTFHASLQSQLNSLITSGFSKAYPEKLRGYNISFIDSDDSIDTFLQSPNLVLHVETRSTRLTTIKVLQKLTKLELSRYQDSYICVRLRSMYKREIQTLICDAFKSNDNFWLIIIECQTNTYEEKDFEDICKHLGRNKKMIFISSKEEDLLNDLKDVFDEVEEISDETRFEDLSNDAQDVILAKNIRLQNKIVPLNRLIDFRAANAIIDEKSLQILVELEHIEIGNTKAFSSIGYVPEYYIERYLHPQKLDLTIFLVKNSIFMVTNITGPSIREFVDNPLFPWDSTNIQLGGIVLPTLGGEYKAFRTLRNNYPWADIVWLDFRQDYGFLWMHCTGDFSEIRKCVDDSYSFRSYAHEDIFGTTEYKRKVFVIANDPGAGKSTVLTSISRKIKRANEDFWVVRINLNDHAYNEKRCYNGDITRSLSEIPSRIDTTFAIQFLCDIVVPSNPNTALSKFQRELFKLGLTGHDNMLTPNIIIFFDGFDEISPTYKPNTIELLKALRKTAIVQMWVTTRTHEKDFLQAELRSPAYVLSNLNESDQEAFLCNYWRVSVLEKTLSFVDDKNKLDDYLKTVETRLSNKPSSISEEIKRLCELPMSNVGLFQREIKNLIDKFDFQAFAQTLVGEWNYSIRDSERVFVNIPLQLKMLGEIVYGKNFSPPENIGLITIFDDFVKHKIEIYFFEKNILVGTVGSGEVSKRDEKLLRKIHSLLALNILLPDLDWQELRTLNDTIAEFGGPVALARVGMLVLSSETRLEFIHRSFAEFFVADYLVNCFGRAVIQTLLLERIFVEEQFYLITVFFNELLPIRSALPEFSDAALSVIRSWQKNNDTFLHRLMMVGYTNIIDFCIGKLNHDPELLEQVLLSEGRYGKSAFFDIFYNSRKFMSNNIIFKVVDFFLNAINNQEIFIKLLTHRYSETLILTKKNCDLTVFQVVLFTTSSNLAIITLFITAIKKKHLIREIYTKNGNNEYDTLFHFCAMNIPDRFTFLVENTWKGDMEEVEQILLMKYSPLSALRYSARIRRHPIHITDSLNFISNHMEDVMLPLLLSQNLQRLTPIDLAIYYNSTVITAFLDFVVSNPQRFDAMLLQPTNECILYKAICQGRKKSTEVILNWLAPYLPKGGKSVLQVLLQSVPKVDGRTCFTLAAARGFDKTIQQVFDWLQKAFEGSDLKCALMELLKSTDYCNNSRTALHESVYWKKTNVTRVLVDFITNKLDLSAQIELFFLVDKWGNTLFELAPDEDILKEYYTAILRKMHLAPNDTISADGCFTPNNVDEMKIFLNEWFSGNEKEDILPAISKIKNIFRLGAYYHLRDSNKEVKTLPGF